MKTVSELRAAFWESHPELKSEYRKTWRHEQYKISTRIAFIDYIEFLNRTSVISLKLAQRAGL